jgi:hypothetical protein
MTPIDWRVRARTLIFAIADCETFEDAEIVAAQHMFGVREHHCARCKKQFFSGSRTGRRSHAVFCSNACRVGAQRDRNDS